MAETVKLDLKGLACPMPIIKISKAIKELGAGDPDDGVGLVVEQDRLAGKVGVGIVPAHPVLMRDDRGGGSALTQTEGKPGQPLQFLP